MTTWNDQPNDYEHALKIIEQLRAENAKLRPPSTHLRALLQMTAHFNTAIDPSELRKVAAAFELADLVKALHIKEPNNDR